VIGLLVGALGTVVAIAHLTGSISDISPGGESALAMSALPAAGPGWQRVLEVDLESDKPVEVWEIQRHHTGEQESSFELVFRTPGRQEVALEKVSSTTMRHGEVTSRYMGTLEPTAAGIHVLEAEVRAVPRAATPELAVHLAGTVGLSPSSFLISFVFFLLLGLSFVGVILELAHWVLGRPAG
jgi:hypothetical protein